LAIKVFNSLAGTPLILAILYFKERECLLSILCFTRWLSSQGLRFARTRDDNDFSFSVRAHEFSCCCGDAVPSRVMGEKRKSRET
jgi:hypothetical protein